MIHSFSVTNYQSIRDEASLDLRIPKTAPDLPRFRGSAVKPDIRLPSVVVLMGPNGSGKTTLLRALITVLRIICNPWLSQEIPVKSVVPFFSKMARKEPTRFCVEFEANWLRPNELISLIRYELSTQDKQIVYEALFHFPKGRPRRLFERGKPGETIYVADEFGMKPKDERLKAVPEDASVIGTLAMLNVPLAKLIVTRLNNPLLTTNLLHHKDWMPTTETVASLMIDPDIREQFVQEIQRSDLAIRDVLVTGNGDGVKEILFEHYGLDTPIPYALESGGTKRLFQLLPQLNIALNTSCPFVIDEIDGDLHVDIVSEIIHRFQSRETNPRNAQLFVTSHNVGLLDDLEKEELFIVEKAEISGTRVHGAQDIQGLRRDTRLYPKYRAGVLGGLPNIG